MTNLDSTMTPKEIVHELDRYIIGQNNAKRAVANALRNRWRRLQLDPELAKEVTPKNILMIGPTGVGKTEIARRLAALTRSPFLKVEATKYTEVGYVGRDVEGMVRDLVEVAYKMIKEMEIEKVKQRAAETAEDRILDILLPQAKSAKAVEESESSARQVFRNKLKEGELDEKEIEVEVSLPPVGVEIMGPPGIEEMTTHLQNIFQNIAGDRTKSRKLTIKDALKQLTEDEASKMLNEDEIRTRAVKSVEQNGIIFIDELDKIIKREGGGDVSREGVQRDLLPIIEGSTVFTKYGMVKTDHVLFIASGAFHLAKPSDLIPELQGRLPIRVELSALSSEDFIRILTEPNASLTEQYVALMKTEGLDLAFAQDGIKRLAEIAYHVNERTENIGARRLHTIMEKLLEVISFEAPDRAGDQVMIDKKYVNKQLTHLIKDEDLSRYIL